MRELRYNVGGGGTQQPVYIYIYISAYIIAVVVDSSPRRIRLVFGLFHSLFPCLSDNAATPGPDLLSLIP